MLTLKLPNLIPSSLSPSEPIVLISIRHLIPSVGDSASTALLNAQSITVESIEKALAYDRDNLKVEVRAVSFPEESLSHEEIQSFPILRSSTLDIDGLGNRKLPYLGEILAGFGDCSDIDICVFTNIDIALQPHFYAFVAEEWRNGRDAMSICRRTVYPSGNKASISHLLAQKGTSHPGHDCFVFDSSLIYGIRPVNAAMGAEYVALAMLWQLMLLARNFAYLTDVCATFHLGDDRPWQKTEFDALRNFNWRKLRELYSRLHNEFGSRKVTSLPRSAEFHNIENPPLPARLQPKKPGRQRPYSMLPRLVFCATTGRSGSEFLTSLLNGHRRIDAAHERPLRMSCKWLRMVSYLGYEATYNARQIKTAAINSTLQRLPNTGVYADISHLFIKTHADIVFDAYEHSRINVISLRRHPFDVAKSFFELDFLGGSGKSVWPDWFILPTAPSSHFRVSLEEIDSHFELIFATLIETEMRVKFFRDCTPSVNWIDVTLEDIITEEGATALFSKLDLSPPKDLVRLLAPVNHRAEMKQARSQPTSRSEVATRWQRFEHKFSQRKELAIFNDRWMSKYQ